MRELRIVAGIAIVGLFLIAVAVVFAMAALIAIFGIATQQWDAVGCGLFAVIVCSTLIYFILGSE